MWSVRDCTIVLQQEQAYDLREGGQLCRPLQAARLRQQTGDQTSFMQKNSVSPIG